MNFRFTIKGVNRGVGFFEGGDIDIMKFCLVKVDPFTIHGMVIVKGCFPKFLRGMYFKIC